MEIQDSPYLKQLFVCVNKREQGKSCCADKQGELIRDTLKAYVNDHGLKGKVRVSGSGCVDFCEQGANIMVYPDYKWYSFVTPADLDRVIEAELKPLLPPVDAGSSGPKPVQAFLFDLGNVLIRFDHMLAAKRLTNRTAIPPEALCQLLYESPLVTDHDEGRISARQFHEGVQRQLGVKIPYQEFVVVWNEIFWEEKEMTGRVEWLLRHYPVYLISNTNRLHFDYLRRWYPVLEKLNGWILSYEVGALKPKLEIYQRALERIQLPSSKVLYIDDRADLIEAGSRLGFQTHRFTGWQAFSRDLQKRGIFV